LLQLNTILIDGKQPLCKASLDRDSIRDHRVSRQYNHLIDRPVQIGMRLSRRRSLDVIPDTVDDISGSVGIVDDTGERFSGFAQIRWISAQKVHGRAGVIARRGNRFVISWTSDAVSSPITLRRFTCARSEPSWRMDKAAFQFRRHRKEGRNLSAAMPYADNVRNVRR
jgi:hypothetical protein